MEKMSQREDCQVQRPQIEAKHHLRKLVRVSCGIERESGSVVFGDEFAEVICELSTCEGSLGMDGGYDR